MIGLSSSDFALLASIHRRMRRIAEGEDEEVQADLLELDVLWRNGVFCKPIPPPRRVRTRRGKFKPKFV